MAEITNTMYPLLHPITRTKKVGDEIVTETITEVPFRKLKPKDLRCTDGHQGEVAKSIAAVAYMTGLTIKEVDNMDIEDFNNLGPLSQGLSLDGLKTGSDV